MMVSALMVQHRDVRIVRAKVIDVKPPTCPTHLERTIPGSEEACRLMEGKVDMAARRQVASKPWDVAQLVVSPRSGPTPPCRPVVPPSGPRGPPALSAMVCHVLGAGCVKMM